MQSSAYAAQDQGGSAPGTYAHWFHPPQVFENVYARARHASLLHQGRAAFRTTRRPRALLSVDFPNQGHGSLSEFFQKTPIWSYQPLKTLFTVVFIAWMGLLYIPIVALLNVPRRFRSRPSWSWKKAVMVSLVRRCTNFMCYTHIALGGKPVVNEPNMKYGQFVWLDPGNYLQFSSKNSDLRGELARAMDLQEVQPARVSGYWYAAPGKELSGDPLAKPGEHVLFHLHGGAYWMGTGGEGSNESRMCRSLLRRVEGKAMNLKRAFLLDYRLASHRDHTCGSYPAALIDALLCYLYLTRHCNFAPEHIVLSGDSSGGNLALALCRYLRDEGVAPIPGALLLLAPWCDVSRSHSGPIPSPNLFSTTVLNRKSDILDPSLLYRNTSVSAFLGVLPASETYRNPYISPVSLQLDPMKGGHPPHWGFERFPQRVYILTGNAELNTEQHVTLAHRMADGTVRGRPVHVGDATHSSEDVDEYLWRQKFPRSRPAAEQHKNFRCDEMEPAQLEGRTVVLDEVRDGVHVFPLFQWFEPERTMVLDRIAAWLADEPIPAPSTDVF